jgi:hypothetical protein
LNGFTTCFVFVWNTASYSTGRGYIEVEVLVLLGCDAVQLGNLFPTFQDNVVFSSSRVEFFKNNVGHFGPWIWDHYFVSKRRKPFTQWREVVYKKNGYFSYSASKILKLAYVEVTWKRISRNSICAVPNKKLLQDSGWSYVIGSFLMPGLQLILRRLKHTAITRVITDTYKLLLRMS